MQHKTTQHKHRTLNAIKKNQEMLLKTKEMIKDYIIAKIKNIIMFPQSQI